MLLTANTIPLSSRFGDEKAIQMLADAGFDGIDYSVSNLENFPSAFSGDHIDYAKNLKKFAYEKGIKFTQAHAPMPYASTKEEYIAVRTEQTIMAMEVASIIGAEVIIVHPLMFGAYKEKRLEFYDMNMAFFHSLIPYAKKYGIKIACENIFHTGEKGMVDGCCASPEEFNKYIDDISSPYFTACLDVGHSEVTGRKAQDVIRAMGGDRITALHIHDNDKADDLHKRPGTVSMEWDEICCALAEIDYKGNFNFEADGYLNSYEDAFLPTALKFMHDTGRYYINKINAYKISNQEAGLCYW